MIDSHDLLTPKGEGITLSCMGKGSHALEQLRKIRVKFKALLETPGLGPPRDDITEGLRLCPVGKHQILYRDTDAELQII